MSGVPFTLPLVQRLLNRFGERLAGLKDSSGDLDYARAVARLDTKFAVFPGTEARLGEGFAGCISATANVTSAMCSQAVHHGDDEALALAVRIRKLMDGKAFAPSVKALLSRIHDQPALADVLPPFVPLVDEEAASLFDAYEEAISSAGSRSIVRPRRA